MRENDRGQKVYASFKCKVYLVKGLKANTLIWNNILALEGFVFNVRLGHGIVENCKVKITIRARQRDQFLRRKFLVESNDVLSLCSEAIIPLFLVLLPDNREFLFYLVAQANLTLFAHIINRETIKVLFGNTSDRLLCISRQQKLGHFVDIRYNNCFLVEVKFALHFEVFSLRVLAFFKLEYFCTPTPTDSSMKTRLDNGVRVYGDKQAVVLVVYLIAKYLMIWELGGFV